MRSIDINSDLGENSPDRIVSDDAAMLDIVTSANVSCGFHAGSPAGIRQTLADAVARDVTIGAHPSYDDYANFGRTEVDVDPRTLQEQVEYQIGTLIGWAAEVGGTVRYVKAHGALYNAIAVDVVKARAVIAAVMAIDANLVFLGLAGGVATALAAESGLTAASEAFADRAYTPEGRLVPRAVEGAVLHDPAAVSQRMLRLAEDGVIEAIDGTVIPIHADSICVHGDSAGAIAMAAQTRRVLEASGVRIAPFAGTRSD